MSVDLRIKADQVHNFCSLWTDGNVTAQNGGLPDLPLPSLGYNDRLTNCSQHATTRYYKILQVKAGWADWAVCLIGKEDFSSFLLTQVEVQEKYVDVPTTLYQEKVVEVPRVQVAEVVKQVPKIDTWKWFRKTFAKHLKTTTFLQICLPSLAK